MASHMPKQRERHMTGFVLDVQSMDKLNWDKNDNHINSKFTNLHPLITALSQIG
jgi:hypothetical protein